MKKAIAFFLLVLMMFSCAAPLAQAVETVADSDTVNPSEDGSSETLRENSVTYTCRYNKETRMIEISGNVNHDVMVTHKNHFIEVYRIFPGSTFDAVIAEGNEPLASIAIAVKFEFSLDAERISERFSKYAIALRAPEGTIILAADPHFAGVDSENDDDETDRASFKGIVSSQGIVGGGLGFGTAVIPVYLDRLLSDTSGGYLYLVDRTYRYFNKTYIDALDAEIRSYSAGGTKVYLQFLLPSGSDMARSNTADGGSIYEMPNVYSEETMALLSAFSEFFAERYVDYRSGLIRGIIVGSEIDRERSNYHGGLSLTQYAEQYAFYLTVVANSARLYRAELDIVIPFSNMNSYSGSSIAQEEITPSALLERILSVLDESFSFPFRCKTLIESDAVPEAVFQQEKESKQKESMVENTDKCLLDAGTLSDYSAYLSSLKGRYESAPEQYMYIWRVPNTLFGEPLAAAYVYSYYKLLEDTRLSSFSVSFSDVSQADTDAFAELRRILRYIDTADSLPVTEHLLAYFHIKEWKDLIPSFSEKYAVRSVYRGDAEHDKNDRDGSFSYFDFSAGNLAEWYCGPSCGELKADYSTDGIRALRANMNRGSGSDETELLCLYEFPENFVYTPFLSFALGMTDDGEVGESLYEVVITIGNDLSMVTSEFIVASGEKQELLLDLSRFNADRQMANYLRVTVRMLEGSSEKYSLWLYEIMGHSVSYTDEELAELIEAERLRIRNPSGDSDENIAKESLRWIIFGIILTVTVVGAGLFMLFRKAEDDSTQDGLEESRGKRSSD